MQVPLKDFRSEIKLSSLIDIDHVDKIVSK